MSPRPSPRWSSRGSTGCGLAESNVYTKRLFEVIDLIRACRLDAAHALATQIRREALAAGDDEAAGRSSSSLGEIAGIRGELETAMREYGAAIEWLENTDLAGSISRAYRGWAYCYLTFQMPRLALQPAREARRIKDLIDVAETRDRAHFECAICDGLVQIDLMNVDEARTQWQSVEHLVARMAEVDDWLPGLFNLLGGRVRIELGKLDRDAAVYRDGIATLERVITHFDASGLAFWTARAHDMLGRAREEENPDAAVRNVRAAAAIYRRVGAAQLLDSAEQWLKGVRPASPNRYAEPPMVARPNRLSPQVTVVEEQLVAGPRTREIVERAMRYAQLPHPVLVMGESGTGKEGVARIIHSAGPRKDGPFVPLNCASIPESLIESMLFGHRRGAFTGAASHHAGLIRQADGGTLFLDEIGELPLDLQPKLLRFLESGRTLTIGETAERTVDVRTVAATNRNLEQAVSAGLFREDLFYRLNVLRLNTAPLRERIEEVPRLAQFIANQHDAKLAMGALNALLAYDWPGNVRQLRNVILRAVGAGQGAVIARAGIEQELAAEMRSNASPAERPAPSAPDSVSAATAWPFMLGDGSLPPGMPLPDAEREFQRFHIARALARHNGNKTRAARDLGMKLQTLHVRAQKLGLT
jgi:DNA-binding NtrC family response regulator